MIFTEKLKKVKVNKLLLQHAATASRCYCITLLLQHAATASRSFKIVFINFIDYFAINSRRFSQTVQILSNILYLNVYCNPNTH